MTLTPGIYAKAIVAFFLATIGAATVSAGGPDLGVLGFGDWVGAVGAGLVSAAGTYGIKNKSTEPVLTPTEMVTNGVQAVVETRDRAQAEYERVTAALTEAADRLPVYGPEAKALIESLPKF